MDRKTDAELIQDAETEINRLMEGEPFDKEVISSCAGKFRTISMNGEGLKNNLPGLIPAIDAAILEFYPHRGIWDDVHRSELLNKYISILERIINEDPVEIDEMKKALAFCAAVRTGFEKFQEKSP